MAKLTTAEFIDAIKELTVLELNAMSKALILFAVLTRQAEALLQVTCMPPQ